MKVIVLWTIWAAAFANGPDARPYLEGLCRDTHPAARLEVNFSQPVMWGGRIFTTTQIICLRSEGETPRPEPPQQPKQPT